MEQVTGDALRRSDEHSAAQPSACVTRIVAEAPDHRVVGYALVAHFSGMAPGRWWIHVTVHPDQQRAGIGRELYRAAEELAREHGAVEVESVCSEDPAEKNYTFARAQGFISDRKRFQMELDLTTWDGTAAEGQIRPLPDLTVTLLPGEPSDHLLGSLYHLVSTTETDVPSFEGVQPAFDAWAGEFRKKKQVVAVALSGEQVVAASFIQTPDEKATGCYWTHNDQDNPAIAHINLSLGFRPLPGLYRLKKRLA